MKLCITEKPSVAKDIAAILGADRRQDGFYEGGDYKVTWTFGHLCTLKEPADYTDLWKRWSLGALPMIPQRFGIKLIADRGIEKQFNVIKKLISEADEVINCGDAGQEGELIQRWVMQKAEIKCPVRRLWISSLTDESIREGFRDLKPEAMYDRLYHAGLSRAIGDWILGMNATRLYSLKYSSPGNVLSIGRVQTPTLALIVQRQLEIENFKPEDYWELKTLYRDVTFNVTSGKFKTEQEAQAALEAITGKPFTVTDVTEKKGKEAPPRLFDLTSLQVECNKKWGWTADDTLRYIQSLYEKKVTTYPRVDTTYLSEDIYKKIPVILGQMKPYASLTAKVLAGKIPKSKKVFDNSKVTDHHAIIPTGEAPDRLVGDERKLYHLIALRFISAFYPDCTFMSTTVLGEVEKVGFKATGKVIVEPGWRVVYGNQQDDDNQSEDKILPPFTVGESGPHEPSLLKKQTQPPKFYTEGTLLRAMESAGKTVEDEELREAMKENGIGRPSTRAAIIETLFKRRYIFRERKNIKASQAGIDLIATINEELLKSAKLTGLWENKLRRIERGEFSASDFISELKALINEIVINVLNDNSARRINVEEAVPEKKKKESAASVKKRQSSPRIKSLEEIVCPVCGKGFLLKGRSAYGCSRFKEGCDFRVDFTECGADLTPARVASFVKKKYKQ
ncbi:DNA topoisomerase III [Barnesiella sp. WM24]|uniref:DNA topoisomerase 3 n=1 Tax=Barnesiella sp. WM24 TaxID=2558278 RepID=UPI0010719683|nr:DNA topoisomerase 3 [Barnesiella sp. WM24]TFU92667.1 DNA topoisomerase III [Barnesiella sp. WM24]